jgi:UDP-3-O-[3-hydroxymyristoyl] N-acetylglucosamine deacetylase / 3-hydroxyacyl-[acyl-carrier-protein] dehydratase
VEKQRTLASSARLTGMALHTGEKVTLTLHPAPVGHGFKFKRSDLPDDPIIEARVENVKTVERATTIVEGNVKIHTVEHVLSALAGMGLDNALVEMDSNEPPIGDGSAAPYVGMIKEAGIVEQGAARAYLEPREPIIVQTGCKISDLVHPSRSRWTLHPIPERRDHSRILRKGNRYGSDVCLL